MPGYTAFSHATFQALSNPRIRPPYHGPRSTWLKTSGENPAELLLQSLHAPALGD
jgi:hypothetical protein